jgi:ABC-type uncharacterized transport system substrate-binding protein
MKRAALVSMLLCATGLLNSYSATSHASKVLNIAMILWRGETKAEQGFKHGLKELGYSVQYTVMNAEQDKTKLGHLLREELKAKLKEFDYIYTFGTTVSKSTRFIVQDQVPHIFNIVAAPVKAGIVRTMQSSGGNISGVSNAIPLSLQIETALRVIKFNRLGLIFNPREKNSMAIRQNLKDMAARFGVEVIDLRSPPTENALQQSLEKLKSKSVVVDAVYLPQDSFIVSKAGLIGAALKSANVKSIGSIKKYIDKGALMGVVPDYYQLGKAAATIVDRHRKGEKLQDIPVYTEIQPLLVINKTTSQLLNVKIPSDLLKGAVIVE